MYTMQEFAEIFKISYSTAKNWIRQGKVNAVKIGRLVRISEEEVNRLKGE